MSGFADPTPVIIWDIDDVWHPWYTLAHQACVEAGLAELETMPTAWKQYETYGCTLQEWVDALDAWTVDGRLHESTPEESEIDVFRQLWADGAEHHFVTARGFMGDYAEHIKLLTREWVNQHFWGFYNSLHFSQDKGAQARLLRATHAIDDSYKNWKSMTEAGVEVYLMDQPWNQDAPVPNGRRVHSIAEFADAIRNGGTP